MFNLNILTKGTDLRFESSQILHRSKSDGIYFKGQYEFESSQILHKNKKII